MKRISIALFVLAVLFALSTIITVDETEQIVILQFGKPVRTIKEPGLISNFPLRYKSPILSKRDFWNMTFLRKKF